MVYHPPSAPGAAPAVAGRFQAGDLVPLSEDAVAPAPAVSSAAPERDTSAPSLTVDTSRPFAGSATPLFASPRLDMDALPPPSAAFAPLAPLPPVAQHGRRAGLAPLPPLGVGEPKPSPADTTDDVHALAPSSPTPAPASPARPPPSTRPRRPPSVDVSDADPWILHEETLGGAPYLVDRSTNVVYHPLADPTEWPRVAGVKQRGDGAGGRGVAARLVVTGGDRVDLFAELDAFLRTRRARLREVFDAHDADGDGNLDARELNALLVDVVPSVSPAQERYFAVMLGVGVDGDAGRRVSFDGFVGAIQEARAAGLAVVAGRDDEIPPALASLHEFMRRHDVTASRVFADADADGDRALDVDEIRDMIDAVHPEATPLERRQLLAEVLSVDVKDTGRLTRKDFMRGLRLVRVEVAKDEPGREEETDRAAARRSTESEGARRSVGGKSPRMSGTGKARVSSPSGKMATAKTETKTSTGTKTKTGEQRRRRERRRRRRRRRNPPSPRRRPRRRISARGERRSVRRRRRTRPSRRRLFRSRLRLGSRLPLVRPSARSPR